MSDIKPDTSLYTDLPNKLRAFALILESPIEERQFSSDCRHWGGAGCPADEALEHLVNEGNYRLKPKPRELWAVQAPDGSLNEDGFGRPVMLLARPETMNGHTPVRFVEQT